MADKYVKPPAQSSYSAQTVNRALYWIKSKAYDVGHGAKTMEEFQGNIEALDNLNIPVACKQTGVKKGRFGDDMPVVECFKYPPLDKHPFKEVKKGSSRSGYKFDGVHCRDGEGQFVPVAQCRRKRKPKKR